MRKEHYNMSCHPFFGYRRRFFSEEEREELSKRHKERKIQWMKLYKESLEQELKGVDERLTKLRKKE